MSVCAASAVTTASIWPAPSESPARIFTGWPVWIRAAAVARYLRHDVQGAWVEQLQQDIVWCDLFIRIVQAFGNHGRERRTQRNIAPDLITQLTYGLLLRRAERVGALQQRKAMHRRLVLKRNDARGHGTLRQLVARLHGEHGDASRHR